MKIQRSFPALGSLRSLNHQEHLAEGVKRAELQPKDPQHIEKFLHDPTQEENSNSRKPGQ